MSEHVVLFGQPSEANEQARTADREWSRFWSLPIARSSLSVFDPSYFGLLLDSRITSLGSRNTDFSRTGDSTSIKLIANDVSNHPATSRNQVFRCERSNGFIFHTDEIRCESCKAAIHQDVRNLLFGHVLERICSFLHGRDQQNIDTSTSS